MKLLNYRFQWAEVSDKLHATAAIPIGMSIFTQKPLLKKLGRVQSQRGHVNKDKNLYSCQKSNLPIQYTASLFNDSYSQHTNAEIIFTLLQSTVLNAQKVQF